MISYNEYDKYLGPLLLLLLLIALSNHISMKTLSTTSPSSLKIGIFKKIFFNSFIIKC